MLGLLRLAEGLFGPTKRLPALPTGLPWGLESLAGHQSPTEKTRMCLWGGRGLKYLRMEQATFPGLSMAGV